jgi:Ca2+-binding RTX toxin-like protein
MFESLENRRLLAYVTATLGADGTLTIIGTSGVDNVYVSHQVAGSKLNVHYGAATPKSFDYASVKKIVVKGGDGHDSLWVDTNVGAKPTSIEGGNGDDRLYSPEGNDTLIGGNGFDNLNGGNGNDYLDGGADNDTINGGNGNDRVFGQAGNDNINGNGGNDTMDGGLGADNIFGNHGNDTLTYASRTKNLVIDVTDQPGELGDDGEVGEKDFVRPDIETIIGGAGHDKITGSLYPNAPLNYTKNNKFVGGAGNDTLLGLDGNDSLDGGTGNDSLDGGAGNDFLHGNLGTDQLIGGLNTDTADYSTHTSAVKLTLDGLANDGATGENDKIYADVENLTGGKGADTITGNGQSNVLRGREGNDTITAGAGNDTLYGDAGLDKLFGGIGDDTFYTRKPNGSLVADNDSLYGDAGNDKAQVDITDVKNSIESLLA